jgi:hypothetical protein
MHAVLAEGVPGSPAPRERAAPGISDYTVAA